MQDTSLKGLRMKSILHVVLVLSTCLISPTFSACGGGEYNGTSGGPITSPNYPSAYPEYVDYCILAKITVEEGFAVMITFDDDFDTEKNWDFARLSDDERSSPFGSYSGSLKGENEYPPLALAAMSCSNTMVVGFDSDYYASGDTGFSANWKQIECGWDLTGKSGRITSPNYPGEYPNYSRQSCCPYKITVDEGFGIVLTFETFNTEDGFDYLEVSQVPSGGPLLGKFTGSDLPSPVSTTNNSMYATFSSDHFLRGAGFSAIWTRTDLRPTLSAYPVDLRLKTSAILYMTCLSGFPGELTYTLKKDGVNINKATVTSTGHTITQALDHSGVYTYICTVTIDGVEYEDSLPHTVTVVEPLLTCKVAGRLSVNIRVHGAGLEATLNVVVPSDMDAAIAITEHTTGDSCTLAGMGEFMDPQDKRGSYYHGVWHPARGSWGYDDEMDQAIIESARLRTDQKHTSVFGLRGFKSLADLAGRGIVVCPLGQVTEHNGRFRCVQTNPDDASETVDACCTLGYATNENFLEDE